MRVAALLNALSLTWDVYAGATGLISFGLALFCGALAVAALVLLAGVER
jgi:hypothetical protein